MLMLIINESMILGKVGFFAKNTIINSMSVINNPKQKRRLVVVYIIMAIAFVVILAVTAMILMGKNLQFSNGNVQIQSTGKLKVASIPTSVEVSVNDKSIDKPLSNDRQVNLVAGNYHVKVKKPGYLPWEKIVTLKTDQVHWVHPRLVPEIKRIKTVKTYANIITSFASPDRRYLINELGNNSFEIVDLRSSNTPRFQAFNMRGYFSAPPTQKEIETGKKADQRPEFGTKVLKFYAWNQAKNSIFFKDVSVPNGKGDMFLIDPETPSATINVSESFKDPSGSKIAFDDLKVADSAGNIVFVRSGKKLYRIDLNRVNSPAAIIFDDVKDFSLVNESILGLLHAAPPKSDYSHRVSLYNYKTSVGAEVDRVPEQSGALMKAFHYGPNEDEDYIAYTSGNRLKIIKGNFKKLEAPDVVDDKTPVLARPDTDPESNVLAAFKDKNNAKTTHSVYLNQAPHKLHISPTSKYLAVDFGPKKVSVETEQQLEQSVKNTNEKNKKTDIKKSTSPANYTEQGQLISVLSDIYTYDMEYDSGKRFEYSFVSGSRPLVEAGRVIKWLDENAMWENVVGSTRIKDFDGQNQRKLTQSLPTFDLQLTADDSRIYYYSKDESGKTVLKSLTMTGF